MSLDSIRTYEERELTAELSILNAISQLGIPQLILQIADRAGNEQLSSISGALCGLQSDDAWDVRGQLFQLKKKLGAHGHVVDKPIKTTDKLFEELMIFLKEISEEQTIVLTEYKLSYVYSYLDELLGRYFQAINKGTDTSLNNPSWHPEEDVAGRVASLLPGFEFGRPEACSGFGEGAYGFSNR